MAKSKTKFWLGLTIGVFGGMLVAHKRLERPRMPNSKIWQRILAEKMGLVEAAAFIARVQQRYEDLMTRRPVFDHLVFDTHVEGNILPGLALYQVWREDGLNHEDTMEKVNWIFETWFHQFPPFNMVMTRLMNYMPENFTFFRWLVRLATDKFFPPPGWQYEIVDDNEHSFAFNMNQCLYLDVLTYFETPELTPVFCRLDDVLMDVMPESIKWGRTQTIGMGGDCCDFCWDFVPILSLEGNE